MQSNRIETPTDSASFWVKVHAATHNLLSSSLEYCSNEYNLPALSRLLTSITISKACMKKKKKETGAFFLDYDFSAADLRIPPSHDFAVQDYSSLGL